MKKIVLAGFALIFCLLIIILYQKIKFEDGKTHIIFCNVGQGDGILIRTSSSQDIILDAGPDSSILSCLWRHTPFWDRDIELMLLSHPHADHMSGMIPIFNNYKVRSFATEGLHNTTPLYKKLTEVIKEEGLESKVLFSGDTFTTKDNLRIKILGPTKEFIARTAGGLIKESKEDGSLVTLVSIGDFDAVLTGDSPLEELETSIDGIGGIEIFQIPHHGSRFNTSEDIIKKINPKLAVISVGKNKYGHPAKEILKILEALEIKTLRTDTYGDIEIVSDGKTFKVL